MPNIKKNFLYSSILTTANYIFPFITYPYVSRVLGVDNVGICNFVDSVINYFILLSMLGISVIGIREIAKNKKEPIELNKTFSSLLALNLITTTIMLIILIVAINSIPQFYVHRELMYIGVFKLIFQYLMIEWLYKGLENFKYITTRTIIIRLVYVIAIFAFVHSKEDYNIYYTIIVSTIVINACINLLHSRKFVSFGITDINIKPYVKPFTTIGLYMILTSMYTSFNTVYLGFVAGETEVGYYTTATKLYTILLSIFTAFTGVMLPRMSSLIAENDINGFKKLFLKSINILFSFSIPLIIFSIMFASPIILLISGSGYEGAVIPMQIVMPLIFIIGYEQIIIIQGLMPLKKDKEILINSLIGASISILCNIVITPIYKSIGSSIAWIASELAVLIVAQYFLWKNVHINFPLKHLIKTILYNVPLIFILYSISIISFPNSIINLVCAGIMTILYSSIIQIFILKDPTFIDIVKKAKLYLSDHTKKRTNN